MDQNNQADQPQDQSQATPKQQLSERIRAANNVLVTVKSNPNVDELAATIGLTLMLNKLGKHATAVFSGEVPSTLEFLKPDETIETNTDSLRDFIVSLDKSKADKLRYKVEENVVKIFITPYKTSITEEDLEFTQGDFNVDVVLALGVTQREELDQAITQHGRILHDATVATITVGQDYSELGQINWQDSGASSLSEMLVSISEALQGGLIDEQIATAFLTGIVSETERFSNTKTSPKVMTMAAQLMAAGANQQLIANELEKVVEVEMETEAPAEAVQNDTIAIDESGTLSIQHDEEPMVNESVETTAEPQANIELPEVKEEFAPITDESLEVGEPKAESLPAPSELEISPILPKQPAPVVDENQNTFEIGMDPPKQPEPDNLPSSEVTAQETKTEAEDQPAQTESLLPPPPPSPADEVDDNGNQIHIDTEGNLLRKAAAEPKHKVIQPLPPAEPELQANTTQDPASSVINPMTPPAPVPGPAPVAGVPGPSADTVMQGQSSLDSGDTVSKFPPPPQIDLTPSAPIQDNTTLEELEASVNSPHLDQVTPSPDSARDAVQAAFSQAPFDPANNARSDIGGLPLDAPPEPTSYDSFRLPDTPAPADPVTDVGSNLLGFAQPASGQAAPAFSLPGQEPPQNDSGIAPPPVPPPMLPG